MNTYTKVAAVLAVVVLVAAPAFAAGAAGMAPAPLVDYQKAYTGTKPVVAWTMYQEGKVLGKAPRPTLGPARLRFEAGVRDEVGTKQVAAFVKPHKAELGARLGGGEFTGVTGTKGVVALARR